MVAQPLTCNQCSSNDIKFNRFYIASPSGGPLPNICTPGTSVAANICVDFTVTSNTRYGFYLAVQYTVNSTSYSFSQCYSETLNQGSFTKCFPITYHCGDNVTLTSVLMAWGNQASDLNTFCQPSNLTCSSLNPKCYSSGTSLPVVEAPLIGNFSRSTSCQGTNAFQTFTFTGSATGGTGPYTYDWDLDGNGTFETLNQSTPSFTYSSTTPVNVTMRVTDSSNPAKTDQQTYTVSPAACTVLPVTLSRFDAKEKDKKAVLSWETTQEIDNNYFLVEYSLDGKSFEGIGRVDGHGTTAVRHAYSFVHATPAVGANYYRLRQTDVDGRFTYSKIKSVIVRTNGELTIGPNPVSDVLTISGLEKAASIQILNLRGHSLYQTTAETAQLKVPIAPSWSNGLYLLRITDQYGRKTFRFMVQK